MTIPLIGERKEKPSPDNMTLNQHLGELRHRLIVCAIAFALGCTVAVIAYEPILHFLIRPLCEANTNAAARRGVAVGPNCANLYVTSPLDGLSLRVKIAVYGGLVLASPVILFQIWRFVTPGLKAREKKYAVPFVTAAVALFLLGAATAYLTLSHALGFLRAVGGPDLRQIYDPIPYLGLVLALMALFGITFQFPVVLVSLELAHVVTPARLLHSWRWAVILITVVAAVFTPSSDPFSMLALAVPLVLFFFISIGIGKLMGR
ncbi:MAG: twin-arginine translocase subunit TatC [Acidimicrobiales bacterium]